MNKTVVREHIPVGDLPESWRQGFPTGVKVRVTVEIESPAPERVLSLDELFALRSPLYKTTEEIVDEVRRDRDDWGD